MYAAAVAATPNYRGLAFTISKGNYCARSESSGKAEIKKLRLERL
jgi:hypothetical protein